MLLYDIPYGETALVVKQHICWGFFIWISFSVAEESWEAVCSLSQVTATEASTKAGTFVKDFAQL